MEDESLSAVIDPERMDDLSHSLGTELTEVIDTYLEDTPAQIAAMAAALACGDQEGLQVLAHSLKSSSGIFGARQMVAICRALEGDDDPASQAIRIKKLHEAYQKVQAVLDLYRYSE